MNNSSFVRDAESNTTVNVASSNISEVIKLKKLLALYKEKLNKENLVDHKEYNILKGCYIDTIIDCYKYIHSSYQKTSLFFSSYEHFKEIFGSDTLDFPKDPEFKNACLHVFSTYKSINITNTSIIISTIKLSDIYNLINKLNSLINLTSNHNDEKENNLINNIYGKAESISKKIKNTINNYKENINYLKKLNALLLDDIIKFQGDKSVNYAKELPTIIVKTRHQINKITYDKLNDYILTTKIHSETSFKKIKILLEPERKAIRDNLDFLESYKKYFENLHRDIIQAFNKKYGKSIDKKRNVVDNYLSTAINFLEKYHRSTSKRRPIAVIISLAHLFINQRGNAMSILKANIHVNIFDTLLPIIEATYEVITGDPSIVSIDNKKISEIIKRTEEKANALQIAQSTGSSIPFLVQKLNNNMTDLKTLHFKDANILKNDCIDIVLTIYEKNNKRIDNTQQSILHKLRLYDNDTKFLQLVFNVISAHECAPTEKIKEIILQKDEYNHLKIALRSAYYINSDNIDILENTIIQLLKKYPYGELQLAEISNYLENIKQEFYLEDSHSFSLSPKEPYSVYLDADDQRSSVSSESTSSFPTESSFSDTAMTENLRPLILSHNSSPIQSLHSHKDKKRKGNKLPPLRENFLKADTPFKTNSGSGIENKRGFNLDDDCDDDDYKINHEALRNASKPNFNI